MKGKFMNIITVREMTPIIGKETLMEERLRRAAGVMSRHGAASRIYLTIAGTRAGNYLLINLYNSFSDGSVAFQKYGSDPEYKKLFMERAINPSGDISGPDIYRSVYGDIPKSPTSIMVNRVYHVPRGKQQEMLALAPDLDALVKDLDVTTSAVVPVMSEDHELMYINYRFSSLDHWGTAVDKMSSSSDFQSLVTKGNEIGTLKWSRMIKVI